MLSGGHSTRGLCGPSLRPELLAGTAMQSTGLSQAGSSALMAHLDSYGCRHGASCGPGGSAQLPSAWTLTGQGQGNTCLVCICPSPEPYLALGQALEAIVHHQHPVALDQANPHSGANSCIHSCCWGSHIHHGHCMRTTLHRRKHRTKARQGSGQQG